MLHAFSYSMDGSRDMDRSNQGGNRDDRSSEHEGSKSNDEADRASKRGNGNDTDKKN